MSTTRNSLDRTRHPLSEARFALFCAAIAPSSIWLLSHGALARPLATLTWSLVCAGLAGSIPGRRLRWGAWLQALALPWTLSWIATVAISGMGPSNAVLASATKGAFKEVLTAGKMAASDPYFVASALLTLAAVAWAFRATRKREVAQEHGTGLVFLCLLILCSASVLDSAGSLSFSRILGPEARIAVPWFSHVGMAKEVTQVAFEEHLMGISFDPNLVRTTSAATRQFSAMPGLGVLMIGDSLRADALLREERGEWSKALRLRLSKGLGVRLPDACAGGNGTFLAVPRLLTGVDVADLSGAARKPTVLALAKAAGARTAYINNHEIWVTPETGHDFLAKTSSMRVIAFDEVAVETLSDFVTRSGPGAKAAVLHLYGLHAKYEDRYPRLMFPEEPESLDESARLELRYGRAAEYNARLLLQAASVLDAQTEPGFLIFTSDHAENLASDHTGKRYHAGPSSGKFDTTVPVLVLWNRAFADSGKPHLLDALTKAPGLIAHRDVAKAWLALEGMPGELVPTVTPMTWGANEPGKAVGAIKCSSLPP